MFSKNLPSFEFTGPYQIFFFYIVPNKTRKIYWPNNVLLVLGRRTGVHRENMIGCKIYPMMNIMLSFISSFILIYHKKTHLKR